MLNMFGRSNSHKAMVYYSILATRNNDVHIIMGSVGQDLNNLELEGIASEPYAKNQFSVKSIKDLPQLHNDFVESICDGK